MLHQGRLLLFRLHSDETYVRRDAASQIARASWASDLLRFTKGFTRLGESKRTRWPGSSRGRKTASRAKRAHLSISALVFTPHLPSPNRDCKTIAKGTTSSATETCKHGARGLNRVDNYAPNGLILCQCVDAFLALSALFFNYFSRDC